jgi:hypothetical protein
MDDDRAQLAAENAALLAACRAALPFLVTMRDARARSLKRDPSSFAEQRPIDTIEALIRRHTEGQWIKPATAGTEGADSLHEAFLAMLPADFYCEGVAQEIIRLGADDPLMMQAAAEMFGGMGDKWHRLEKWVKERYPQE